MGILLPSSLSFLTRLKEIVPIHSDVVVSTLTSFLDDFLINVFEPQMEETLTEACGAAYGQTDAFQDDPRWQMYATKPLFKSTIDILQLINSFCRMLVTLPHNPTFSELILAQIRTHYNRLNDIYRTLVTKPQTDASTSKSRYKSASLAEGGDMLPLIKTLVNTPASATPEQWAQETDALMNLVKSTPMADADFLSSSKSIRQLCVLFTSSTWFAARLQTLRRVDTKSAKNNSTSLATHQARGWIDTSATDEIYLPLNQDTAQEFDSLTLSLNNLAGLVLRTLHLELRLSTLSGVARALSASYELNQPFNGPDPAILALNATVLATDAELSGGLPPPNRHACEAHLADAVDAALVALASRVPAMDEHGAARMALNILVLQQGLKEIDQDAELGRAAAFWDTWDRTGSRVTAECKAGHIGKPEAKEMVRLCFSAGGDEKKRDQMLASIA